MVVVVAAVVVVVVLVVVVVGAEQANILVTFPVAIVYSDEFKVE